MFMEFLWYNERMNRRARGFTLIELIVVIVVIGILAGITIVGLSRYQQDTRDARRTSSATVIAGALEKYYDANGEYPGCTTLDAEPAALTNNILTGITEGSLVAPNADNAEVNSLKCTEETGALTINGEDFFEYQGDGSTDCAGSGICLGFTLRYKDESGGAISEIGSRRIGTVSSTAPTLSVTSSSFTSIDASWTNVANASGYTLQRSTDSGFVNNLVSIVTNSSTLSTTANSLNPGGTYYFRVHANSVGGDGPWSDTENATTSSLAIPVITAVSNSNSQITVTWPDVADETSYTLQYTTSSSSFTSPAPTSITGIAANATSRVITGLSTGVTYYFRLQAVSGATVGGWSTTKNATTFVPAPTSMVATTNSTTQITADWADVGVATSYTLQYDQNSSFSSPATITGITSSVRAVTGLTQGERYWFRAYAVVSSTSSDASPSDDATTSISGPSSVSISSSVPNAIRAYASGNWIYWNSSNCTCGNWYYAVGTASASCPSGSSRQFRFGSNYTSPTTFRGWTGWTTGTQRFMVQPYNPYGIRFHVQARCVGSDATSGVVQRNSSYAY